MDVPVARDGSVKEHRYEARRPAMNDSRHALPDGTGPNFCLQPVVEPNVLTRKAAIDATATPHVHHSQPHGRETGTHFVEDTARVLGQIDRRVLSAQTAFCDEPTQ